MPSDESTAQEVGEEQQLHPGDLSLDDRLEFDGHEYVVVGTGPAEAALERVDDSSIQLEVFRWAIVGTIGIELETTVDRDQFQDMVELKDGGNDE